MLNLCEKNNSKHDWKRKGVRRGRENETDIERKTQIPESLIFAAQQGVPYTASSIMSQSRGMGSSVIGSTEEERDLLGAEEESDVGGDDRLPIDTREEGVGRRSMTCVNATRMGEESRHHVRMSGYAWHIVRCVE